MAGAAGEGGGLSGDLTVSEQLFERYCQSHEIPYQRVSATGARSPDYEMVLAGQRIVVEVNEIEPNENERAAMERTARGEVVVHHVTPGERVRRKITSQSGQIRARAQRVLPGLLVLFDDGLVIRHLDPDQIRVAMEGFDTMVLAVPDDPREGIRNLGTKAGKRKKMTPMDNTSVSAIGALALDERGQPELTIYHNRHAAVPLDPAILRPIGVVQFGLSHRAPGAIGEWVAL
jgi:hypothetical protein